MKNKELSNEDKIYLENKLEKFLNEALFDSDLLKDDFDFEGTSLEEKAIRFLIKSLNDRIDYY